MGLIKKMMGEEDDVFTEPDKDKYYDIKAEEALEDGNSKMILLEPRAYSESQQIADHLKKRNTVVVNLKKSNTRTSKKNCRFLKWYNICD